MKDRIQTILELWNKVTKKHQKNTIIDFLELPHIYNEEFQKKEKNKIIDLKKIPSNKLKIEMRVLDTIYENYKKLFITNEAMKSLNTIIVPPFAINTPWKKESRWDDYISFYDSKGKFNIKKTKIFACYSPSEKQFIWTNFQKGTVNNLCDSFKFLNNLSFCKSEKLLNVDQKTADSLALWVRTSWFTFNFIYPEDKDMKSYNLLKFDIELENKKQIILYTISDYGIKNPDIKLKKKIFDQLNTLDLMIKLSLEEKKRKKMKGHKIKFTKKLSNKLKLK